MTTPDGVTREGRSVLIPPRLTHQLICLGSGLVSCYLEPTSVRARILPHRDAAVDRRDRRGSRSRHRLAFTPSDDQNARRWLDLAAPATANVVDPRIAAAARRIRDDPATSVSSRELAAEAGLSESRFLHLFRDELGTSLRRYRIWVRLVHAGTAIAAGSSLTEAAMKAGFASPSHLADRFKTTFGLSASQLLGAGLTGRIP